MKCIIIGIAIASVIHLVACQAQRTEIQRHLEFEDVLSEQQIRRQLDNPLVPELERFVWRSEANNVKTLRIVDMTREYSVNIRLCISPQPPFQNVTIRVENIRYANDGPSDTLYLLLDGVDLGIFLTFEKWGSGHEWNVFHETGPIGDVRVLNEGVHTLSLQAVTDKWGVEYDRIAINAENQNQNVRLICDSELIEPRG